MWPGINDFYAIREEIGPGLFLSRTKEGKKRNLYFTNSLVKDIVNLNQEDIKVGQEYEQLTHSQQELPAYGVKISFGFFVTFQFVYQKSFKSKAFCYLSFLGIFDNLLSP